MDFNEALQHAGILPSEINEQKGVRIPEHVREAIRGYMPRYLWIVDNYEQYDDTGWELNETARKLRRLHCEACGNDEIEQRRGKRWKIRLGQNEEHKCPMCGASVTVKHVSRGFKSIEDRVDVVWYDKSAIDPEVIVGYAAHCARYFSEVDPREPWELDASVSIREAAAIRWGEGGVRIKTKPIWQETGNGRYEIVEFMYKRVKSMEAFSFGDTCFSYQTAPDRFLLDETLTKAVRDTPFERAWNECYLTVDGLYTMDFIARHPCVEYMTKLRMETLVRKGIARRLEKNLINWNGKSMEKVLKLSRERLGEIKGAKLTLTPELLAVTQVCEKMGVRIAARTAADVARTCAGSVSVKADLTRMLELFQPSRRKKAVKYLARWGAFPSYLRLSDFEDYWSTETELGGNLDRDDEAFPSNFQAAHDRAVARRKAAANALLDAAIRNRAKKLSKRYGFEFGGLILRPAESAKEVIHEGEALHHCVARYVEKYAEGKTVICVLRRAVEPEKPWRTVEISTKGDVLQDRGLHNDWGKWNMIDEKYRAMLDLFWQAWKERGKAA